MVETELTPDFAGSFEKVDHARPSFVFALITKFCSSLLPFSHKTTQFSFMCPLGDPNSGFSGMCVCVGGGRARGRGDGHVASGMPVSVCAAVCSD